MIKNDFDIFIQFIVIYDFRHETIMIKNNKFLQQTITQIYKNDKNLMKFTIKFQNEIRNKIKIIFNANVVNKLTNYQILTSRIQRIM